MAGRSVTVRSGLESEEDGFCPWGGGGFKDCSGSGSSSLQHSIADLYDPQFVLNYFFLTL